MTKGVGGMKLVRIPVKAALQRIVCRVNKKVGKSGGFGTMRAKNPSNNYLARGRLSAPVSFSGLLTTNSVVKSKKVVIVSRSSYVMSMTHFFLSFAMRRSYNGYAPYHVNGGQLLRLLGGVARNGTARGSLRALRALNGIVGSATLYKLKRASPGPMLSALSGFCSRCVRRMQSGAYHTGRYGSLLACCVGPSLYVNYRLYTGGYPTSTVVNLPHGPRAILPRGYVGYNVYVTHYGFGTVSMYWSRAL